MPKPKELDVLEAAEEETEDRENVRRRFLTYFLLIFPTFIIAIIPSKIGDYFWISLAIKTLLAFYQFIVIKNFVDMHYD